MVARGAGAVGCAHCTLIGADRSCQVCTRLVCETCAADWATCREPSGRVVRLGLSARLRDVDPLGRLGLVSHWRRPPRLFDLRRLRWINAGTHGVIRSNRAHPARLTGDGRVIYGVWKWDDVVEGSQARIFDGMRVVDLRRETSHVVTGVDAPARNTAVTASEDIFYYVTDSERVTIATGETSYAVDPLPRRVIQAAHIDATRRLLAATSWSEVALHRIVDETLERVSYLKTEQQGDIEWVAVAGPWVAYAVRRFGTATVIEVRRLGGDLVIGDVVHRHAGSKLHAASLSRDGRYLAAAFDDRLLVHELATDTVTFFTEHTDKINLVRFAGDDHVLISADTDNRVVLRPRTETGYARPLIAIDVPDAGIELPPQDAPVAPR
ncbi:MAG TPA: hypothetical protein VIV11_26325 [Kofleriaceae bacterium]